MKLDCSTREFPDEILILEVKESVFDTLGYILA